jgi:dCTP deaminase
MELADHQIDELCRGGMVTPYDPALLNPASLDLRLGDTLLIEKSSSPELVPYPLGHHSEEFPYFLVPGQWVLAETVELFTIPDWLSVQFILKSSRAREGFDHALAGFGDPGWHGSRLTMELKNNRQLHPIPLWPGMRIGQMKFSRMSSEPRRSYRETGRYNGDTTVQASRG